MAWMHRLRRVFDTVSVVVEGSKVIASIEDLAVVADILKHLNQKAVAVDDTK